MAARRSAPGRETKMTSRKGEASAEAAPAKKSGGLSMMDGLAIITTILLIGAILVTDYNLGQMGEGVFFKK